MGLKKQLRKLGDKVVKNAPIIAAVVTILVPGVGAAIGTALGATGTTAVVVGNAALAAGATALNPDATAKDILTAGVAGGAGAYAGTLASQSTSAAIGGTSGKIAGSAAGGAAGSATQALVSGAKPEDALKAGLKGAAVGGLSQAGVEFGRGVAQAGRADLRAPKDALYASGSLNETGQLQSSGLSPKVPTGGGTGLKAQTGTVYSTPLAPSETMRYSDQGLQPAYQSGQSMITPAGLSTGSPYREQTKFGTPALSRTEESLLKEGLELGISESLVDRGGQPTQQPQTAYLGTGSSAPGSQALAQALRVDSGTALFGSDKEGQRRPVWNVESLKVKDEMGA
jgi:hypothetical protein